MTKSERFKLVAKILKQYAPNSEDRAIASLAIKTFDATYGNNPKLLKLKLETLVEEAA
jgi:hypothetical protein